MKRFSLLLIFLAGTLWGTMGLFVRSLTASGLSSAQVAGIRSLFTAAMLAVVLLLLDRKLFRIRLRDLWCFVGSGVMSITFFNCCYFFAIGETSMSVAAILLYTAPVFVVLMSAVFFKERITAKKAVALVICFMGCVLVTDVFSHSGGVSAAGILAGIGSGIGYALYSIFSRAAINRGYKTLTILFYTFLLSSAASLIVIDFSSVVTQITDGEFLWGTALLQAAVTTVAPYLLYTLGLAGTENGTASIVASVEPVVATLLGFIFFNETPSLSSAVGIVLVLTAIVILNLKAKKLPSAL